MGTNEKQRIKRVNWNLCIPFILWLGCLTLGIIKSIIAMSDSGFDIVELIEVFNSNTFSTFISVVVCKLYQYFIEKDELQEAKSGLSRKNMPGTIIITVIYVIVNVFDVALNDYVIKVIFLISNIVYVMCFFLVFLANKNLYIEEEYIEKEGGSK